MTFAKTIDIIFSSIAFRQVMLKMVKDIKQMIVQYVTQRQVDKLQREMQEQLAKLMEEQEFQIPEDMGQGEKVQQEGQGKQRRRALRWNVEMI